MHMLTEYKAWLPYNLYNYKIIITSYNIKCYN